MYSICHNTLSKQNCLEVQATNGTVAKNWFCFYLIRWDIVCLMRNNSGEKSLYLFTRMFLLLVFSSEGLSSCCWSAVVGCGAPRLQQLQILSSPSLSSSSASSNTARLKRTVAASWPIKAPAVIVPADDGSSWAARLKQHEIIED